MSDCECLSRCPFFNDRMAEMPAMAHLMKKNYCQGDFLKCARHRVLLGKGAGNVPNDLFPNMQARADELLSGQ
ncbi:MAG: hypothetical protein H6Q00_1329 [Holophagaceae bacterium]|nr:hypothetical protein [Holophagaceae bacterium]